MNKSIAAVITMIAFSGVAVAQTPAAATTTTEKPAVTATATTTATKTVAAKTAATKPEVTNGKISMIDTTKGTITVKDAKGAEKVFNVEASKLATLKQGETVKVTVKDGKTSVKGIKEHKKAETKKAAASKAKATK